MTLNRLVLNNYMIHKELAVDFNGNLIALTGEMGHGKSTFVGAIQFCLTGEHPPWTKADLLSWGTTEGSAKLYFTHEGLDCSVTRALHCSSATLKIGEDTVTGVRNVEIAMTERLGVDKDILKQIGFVQQYEIQSILFDDPSKRERSFQKLLGIGDVHKVWTELGTLIQGYSKPENFDASIESLKQLIKGLTTELEAVDKTLSAATEALSLLPSQKEMQAEIERLAKIQSNISLLEGVRSSIVSLNNTARQNSERIASLQATRAATIATLGCEPHEMEAEIQRLGISHNTVLSELNNMRKLSGVSDKDGSCPLCGTHVAPGHIAEYTSTKLADLTEAEHRAKQIYEQFKTDYDNIKSKIDSLDNSIRTLSTALGSSVGAVDSEKAREKQLLMEFAALNISPEVSSEIEALKQDVNSKLQYHRTITAQYSELSSQVALLQGEKNAKSQQLARTNEMLEAKIKEKELSVPMEEKIEILTRVRNWFHSSNGPRTMSLSAIKDMTGYVNEYLKAFHSEIEVTPDNQGLSFAYEYIDGRPISDPPPATSKLSGGQKIELALAFRLAIYRYFGQKMGIMVLDEPTAHLSPAGIEYFGELLQTVSTLARNMNLQIIMPTHEKEIMPFMDSEIHFS